MFITDRVMPNHYQALPTFWPSVVEAAVSVTGRAAPGGLDWAGVAAALSLCLLVATLPAACWLAATACFLLAPVARRRLPPPSPASPQCHTVIDQGNMDNAGQTTYEGTNVDPANGATTTASEPIAAQEHSGAGRRLLRGRA